MLLLPYRLAKIDVTRTRGCAGNRASSAAYESTPDDAWRPCERAYNRCSTAPDEGHKRPNRHDQDDISHRALLLESAEFWVTSWRPVTCARVVKPLLGEPVELLELAFGVGFRRKALEPPTT